MVKRLYSGVMKVQLNVLKITVLVLLFGGITVRTASAQMEDNVLGILYTSTMWGVGYVPTGLGVIF